MAEISLADDALDVATRGKADCLVITGRRTGFAPSIREIEEVRNLIKDHQLEIPILVGSGISPENAFDFLRFCDGFIIGSCFRKGGIAGEPIETQRLERIAELIKEVENIRWA
jgi:predicted TIM-barrel enzyme